jgi:hypothetical protein
MTFRPLSVPLSIQRRSAADHDLSHLFAEIGVAREADRLSRDARRRDHTLRSDSSHLTSSLSAYARALEGYRLPVPRTIRDELRLRRRLSS